MAITGRKIGWKVWIRQAENWAGTQGIQAADPCLTWGFRGCFVNFTLTALEARMALAGHH